MEKNAAIVPGRTPERSTQTEKQAAQPSAVFGGQAVFGPQPPTRIVASPVQQVNRLDSDFTKKAADLAEKQM